MGLAQLYCEHPDFRKYYEAHNPFENPEISKDLNALIEDTDDFFRENSRVLDPQLESKEWGKLCALCQSEVKKANNELVQLLKAEGTSPTLENTEASEGKTSIFN